MPSSRRAAPSSTLAEPRPRLPAVLRKRWRQAYEEAAYRDLPWFSPRPYRWLREVFESGGLGRGGRLLDVGCGAGTNAIYLARSGFAVSGIDLAPGAIRAGLRRARRAGLDVDFRVGDALRLPFPPRRFGAIIDIGCFHTLPTRLRDAYAREIARVIRPGGRFALAWVAREFTGTAGPPHRPSVEETAHALERQFLFLRAEFLPRRRGSLPAYGALLERRDAPQPAPR